MGRGRQKAKHTKVARELKYNIPETDYEKLQRELQGSGADYQGADYSSNLEDADETDEMSKWAEYLDEDDFDDEDDAEQRRLA